MIYWWFVYISIHSSSSGYSEILQFITWIPVTVPEIFYFPIFAFAHRSLIVCSLSVHHSLTVHNFTFTVQRALAFTSCSQSVHRSLTVLSVIVHKTFIVRSSFLKRSAIFIRNSKVKGWFLKQWQNKDCTCAEWWVKTFSLYQKFHC